MDNKVFKVCEEDEWEWVKNDDFFFGSEIDQIDGFIHFSTSEQLKETLEKHFKSKSPLYLLEVEIDDLEIFFCPSIPTWSIIICLEYFSKNILLLLFI